MNIPCSRWVYIFGMENEGDFFGGIIGDTVLGQVMASDLYKIGTTVNPRRRWQQVQVHSPWELRVFAVFPGGYKMEAKIHKHFDEYRTRGEWFTIPRHVMHGSLKGIEGHLTIAQESFPELPWHSFVCEGAME